MKQIIAILLLFACAITLAAQAGKADVTGTWILSVESAAGASSPTATFKARTLNSPSPSTSRERSWN